MSLPVPAHAPPAPDALIDRYLTHVRVEKRLAARSVELYAGDLQQLAALAAAAGLPLVQVQHAHVRQWVARMRGQARSTRGIARILSAWRGFYAWLGREDLIRANPVQDVRPPREEPSLPKALTVDEAMHLAAQHVEGDDPWLDARDAAIVELLYGCGLRVAELTGLDVAASDAALRAGRGWIDLAATEVQVQGKGGKRRAVRLGDAALAALAQWLPQRISGARNPPEGDAAQAVFIGRDGTRLTSQSIWQRLKRRGVHAQLRASLHPHVLRHSFASHLLQSSGDLRGVQEMLGHAHIRTTQVYTRLDFQHLATAYDAAHPRAKRRTG
ncbi:MAG: tyrosine recombinase XerC [Pseudomonadota bacterium]|nr:tyrosine recombinase XerC [Pseudomonadota bacterium]